MPYWPISSNFTETDWASHTGRLTARDPVAPMASPPCAAAGRIYGVIYHP
jgi:hypothetical protein